MLRSVLGLLNTESVGLIADFAKNKLHLPRSFCISLVALLFIVSQITVFSVDEVKNLWKGSALLGFAYGSLFGLFPTITIEWFGLCEYPHSQAVTQSSAGFSAHFSENWGFVSLAPMIGGNIFSIAFGRNLDAHAPSEPEDPSISSAFTFSSLGIRAGTSDSSHQCLQGKECYIESLLMTTTACSIALVLALYAAWRDYKDVRRYSRGRTPAVELVWEDVED